MKEDKEFKLFQGRPEKELCESIEEKVYDFLDETGIVYKTLKHPAAFTMEECRNVRNIIKAPVAKNLFLTNKQQTKFYLLVMPADKVFKTKYLSSQINSARLSFASSEHMQELLGVSPGSVTPLGLINDVKGIAVLLLDKDLKEEKEFACHPCINTASVVLNFKDFCDKVLPSLQHEVNWVDLPWE